MDRKTFIKSIATQAGQQEIAKARAAAEQHVRLNFAQRVTVVTRPIAEQYRKDLAGENILAKVTGHDSGVTFELCFANGEKTSLTMYPSHETGRLEFVVYLPGTSKYVAGTYDENNWKDDTFEEELQRFLKEAVDSAPKHGGIKRPPQRPA